MFELLCQQLLRRNPDRFHALPDNPDDISNRGHRGFSRTTIRIRRRGEIGTAIC